MAPIYFTINNNLPIMVIPNVKIHMDGHPILAYSYNIFYGREDENVGMVISNLHIIQDKLSDPNYFGCLAFEDPESLFSFTPDGQRLLTRPELEEIVDCLKHYRDNPSLWNLHDN